MAATARLYTQAFDLRRQYSILRGLHYLKLLAQISLWATQVQGVDAATRSCRCHQVDLCFLLAPD